MTYIPKIKKNKIIVSSCLASAESYGRNIFGSSNEFYVLIPVQITTRWNTKSIERIVILQTEPVSNDGHCCVFREADCRTAFEKRWIGRNSLLKNRTEIQWKGKKGKYAFNCHNSVWIDSWIQKCISKDWVGCRQNVTQIRALMYSRNTVEAIKDRWRKRAMILCMNDEQA